MVFIGDSMISITPADLVTQWYIISSSPYILFVVSILSFLNLDISCTCSPTGKFLNPELSVLNSATFSMPLPFLFRKVFKPKPILPIDASADVSERERFSALKLLQNKFSATL